MSNYVTAGEHLGRRWSFKLWLESRKIRNQVPGGLIARSPVQWAIIGEMRTLGRGVPVLFLDGRMAWAALCGRKQGAKIDIASAIERA